MRFKITNIKNNVDTKLFDVTIQYLNDDNSKFSPDEVVTLIKNNYQTQQSILEEIATQVKIKYERVTISNIVNVTYNVDTLEPV